MVKNREIHNRNEPKQERSKDTVESILRATAHILAKDGYAKCSTNKVATKAGVSIGSLYQYFDSREALVTALAERHAQTMQQLLRQAIVELGPNTTFEKTVKAYIHSLMAHHAQNPALHRILFEEVPRISGIARIHELGLPAIELIQMMLESRRKHFRKLDTRMASFILVNTVRSAIFSSFSEENMDFSKLEAELVQLVLRYLGFKKSSL
jgi:AcrR family transcriptional regulator